MRIEEFAVSGFRGFRDERRIEMAANVVIISGPNGSGKTSLLDAIQWLLLGDVPRLRSSTLKKDEDYLSNRYASSPPFVEASLRSAEGEQVRVSRRGLGKSMQVQVDGASEGALVGDSAQQWLNSAMSSSLTGLGEADLVRRYVLQQDDMREFLGADTKERYEFIAALSGMERLTNLEDQMKEELSTLRRSVRDLGKELAQTEGELETTRGSASSAREMAVGRADKSEADAAASRAEKLLENSGENNLLAALRKRRALIDEKLQQLAELERRERRARELLRDLPKDPSAEISEREANDAALAKEEEQLETDLSSTEAALRAANTAADRAQQLAALALEQIDGPCPVCGQEHDVEATRAHLTDLLDTAPALADLTAGVEAKGNQLAEVRGRRAALQTEIAKQRIAAEERDHAEELLQGMSERVALARKALISLLPSDRRKKAASNPSDDAETFASDVEELAVRLQRAADAEARSQQAVRRVEALDQQQHKREKHGAELADALAAQEAKVDRAQKARSDLGLRVTDVMREVANSSTGLINEIYRRLDVHPTFREFGFRTQRYFEAGHLRPWVYDRRRDKDGNALHVLSAAQLNSLAICLFLALNIEHDAQIRTAILDDPVQSLDDVNLLGLADLLRTVRSRRQVIVSTHDETLAELLSRKLRPLDDGDATAVVNLDKWGESGPMVETAMRDVSGLEPEFQLLAEEDS